MQIIAFGGRLLLSTIFIMSGVSKLTSYDAQTGGPMMHVVAPKMDCFLRTIDQATQLDLPLDVVKVQPVASRQRDKTIVMGLSRRTMVTWSLLLEFWKWWEVCFSFWTFPSGLVCWYVRLAYNAASHCGHRCLVDAVSGGSDTSDAQFLGSSVLQGRASARNDQFLEGLGIHLSHFFAAPTDSRSFCFSQNVSIFGGLLAYATKAGKYQKLKME